VGLLEHMADLYLHCSEASKFFSEWLHHLTFAHSISFISLLLFLAVLCLRWAPLLECDPWYFHHLKLFVLRYQCDEVLSSSNFASNITSQWIVPQPYYFNTHPLHYWSFNPVPFFVYNTYYVIQFIYL
jgi:hypothetical protein